MKKKEVFSPRGTFILALVILLIIPIVSAGFFDFLGDMNNLITGRLTSSTTSLSITIGNTAPVVDYISSISSQSVTESGTTAVTFTFTATDTDGVANLDDATAKASFNRTGETTRTNSSCSLANDVDTDTANYTCKILVYYWDGAGTWTVNASIEDINSAYGENTSTTFSLSETTAMVMSPTALTWTSIGLLSTNQLSNNDPITINNTANKDITDGNVKVTAIDMQGLTTTTEYLLAGNFTVNTADACDTGTIMVNRTATGISGATITAGNNSAGNGQEQVYFCLEEVSSGISQQSYSTASSGAWTIGVS